MQTKSDTDRLAKCADSTSDIIANLTSAREKAKCNHDKIKWYTAVRYCASLFNQLWSTE